MDPIDMSEDRGNLGKNANSFFHPSRPTCSARWFTVRDWNGCQNRRTTPTERRSIWGIRVKGRIEGRMQILFRRLMEGRGINFPFDACIQDAVAAQVTGKALDAV